MTIWIRLVASLALGGVQDTGDGLTWERFTQVRQEVLPAAEEDRWLAIPWRSRLWDAVEDARRERKPILLWAMNGHPLGCV
jgi:hypothetical protein